MDEAAQLRSAATEHQAAGRFETAYGLLRRRAMLVPKDPEAWADIARCLAAAGMLPDALKAWDAALAVAPGGSPLLLGKAEVLERLGRSGEARGLVAAAPGSFDSMFRLARLALEAGDWEEAARVLASLESQHGGRPEVAWLAIRVALGQGELGWAERRARQLATDSRLGAEQRADLLLLRAEALDRQGRPADAFKAAAAGKALQRGLFAGHAEAREGAAARLERLAALLAPASPADWAAKPIMPVAGEPSVHAFILGFPRSGTTLLEQALAGHPDVVALEEPPTLAAPAAEFLRNSEGVERLARLPEAQIRAWRARYFAEVRAMGADPAGKVLVDKAPAETASLPLIARLFPEARVLFAVRDPRDVVLSCFVSSFQMNALTYAFTDLLETAAAYAATMRMAEACRRVLPLSLMEVRHEALVQDFQSGLAEVAAFLGIRMHPAMADIAATARARSVRTPSAPQVRGGLTTTRLGRWRAYADALAPVQSTLEPWVGRFGYA